MPFAPGGTTDILARLIGQRLTDAFGQPVIIDNRPGANGSLGSEIVAKSPPDGHTLVMGYLGSLAINPRLYSMLPYDPVRDFAPVTLVASTTQAIVIHPSLPVRSTQELIALAKHKPGQISYQGVDKCRITSICASLDTHRAVGSMPASALWCSFMVNPVTFSAFRTDSSRDGRCRVRWCSGGDHAGCRIRRASTQSRRGAGRACRASAQGHRDV